MQVGVLVVLFRPSSEHLEAVRRLAGSGLDVLCVDNTPAPDATVHDRLRAAGIEVLDNRNRGGLAGAYNRGAELLVDERGHDGFFLLDQDSAIETDFFEQMTAACAPLRGTAFLAGPRIFETRMGIYMPLYPHTDTATRPEFPGLTPVDFVISSGSLVSAAAWLTVGAFREDLVIESIDIDYSHRAWTLGVPTYAVTGVELRQTTGSITQHGSHFTFNHAAPRCYYRVRNYLQTRPAAEARSVGYRRAIRFAAQQMSLVVRYEEQKSAKVLATVVGVVDGVRGRLGPFEERHPHLAQYCDPTARTPRQSNSAPTPDRSDHALPG